MITSHLYRTSVLFSLTIFIAVFLHCPFFNFPSSLFTSSYVDQNTDTQLDIVTFSRFSSHISSVNSSPDPNQLLRRKNRPGLQRRVDSEDVYLASVKKGWALRCLMDATLEEAINMVQHSPKWKNFKLESNFIDPLMAPIEWGWITETLGFEGASNIMSDYKIDKMLAYLHVATDLKFWTQQLVSHQHAWYSEDGRTGPAIKVTPPSKGGARYKTLFNGLSGDKSEPTIVLLEMYAPIPEIKALQLLGMLPKGTILPPDLQKTSDLVFLNYYLLGATEIKYPGVNLAGGSPIPYPKHFIIPFIDNTNVVAIMSLAFQKIPNLWDSAKNQPFVKPAPGVRFDPASEAGRAILGTAHGSAVSFFLIQHKKQLGLREVKEIRVWHEVEGGDLNWYLYFGIGDVRKDAATADVGKRGNLVPKASL